MLKGVLPQSLMVAAEEWMVKKAILRVVDRRTHSPYEEHPNVQKLEAVVSQKAGGLRVLGTNGGTDALILALKLSGIGPGDEVIVPAFCFIPRISCVPWVGATPVFVDVRSDDYALDPAKIEEKITERTKAIIVSHLFGQPAGGTEDVLLLAKRRGLVVIEDATQSFGAKMKIGEGWKMVGTLGDFGALSFTTQKWFAGPGNSGALILKDPALWDEGDRMRFYGARVHHFDYPTVGVNCKMHDLQAAALLAKLPFFDYWFEHRRKIAALYTRELAGIDGLVLPADIPGTERTWYRYVVRTQRRDDLLNHLLGVTEKDFFLQPSLEYPVPVPYFEVFRELGHKPGDFPCAERLAREVISLPLSQYVSIGYAGKVAKAVRIFYALEQR